MRRVAAITLVALAAVSSAGAAQAPPTLAPGTLTVALSLPSPGFQAGAVRPGGAVVAARGFEIDLARSLAARLGLKRVRFVNEPSFPRLLAGGRKQWDVALAEVTITDARRRTVDFSSPYLRADTGVLLAKDLAAPKSLAELGGLRLCYQAGTTAAGLISASDRGLLRTGSRASTCSSSVSGRSAARPRCSTRPCWRRSVPKRHTGTALWRG